MRGNDTIMTQTPEEIQALISVKQQKLAYMMKDANKLKQDIENLKKKKDKAERSIKATEHCISRFIERIGNMPKGAIRAMMKDHRLIEMINANGDGKYILPSYPRCTVVVVNRTIVTCYLNNTIELQLGKLTRYMGYFINCKAHEYKSGETLDIKPFEQFETYLNYNVAGA